MSTAASPHHTERATPGAGPDAPSTPGSPAVPPGGIAAPPAEARTGIGFARLVAVELRKMVDTRAGAAFHLVVVALTVAAVVLAVVFEGPSTFDTIRRVAQLPLALFLPLLGVLVAAGEWTHRSAMVTFALEPRRHRIVFAKIVAVVLVTLAYVLLLWALSAAGALASGPSAGAWEAEPAVLAGSTAALVIDVLCGFAIGLVLASGALGILAYFLLPIVLQIATLWGPTERIVPWIAIERTLAPVVEGATPTALEWQRIGTSVGLWVVLLTALGLWLTARREAK